MDEADAMGARDGAKPAAGDSADVGSLDGPRRLSLLSVVASLHDAAGELEGFDRRVRAALQGVPFELVLVDDGSTDTTGELLEERAAEDPRVRVVTLSRSFGPESALTAGLDHAHGDAIVVLDPDLRDPPEAIHALLDQWRAGADVVYGVRERGEGERSFGTTAAGWLARPLERLAGVELEPDAGELRLLDRRALQVLQGMGERARFLRGMTVWVGLTQTAVAYRPEARPAHAPKPRLGRLLRHSFDATTALSDAPLRAATTLAFVLCALALVAVPVALLVGILHGLGTTAILVSLLVLGAVGLLIVAVLGAYLGRVYDEVKRRPVYVVRDRRNLPVVERAGGRERESALGP